MSISDLTRRSFLQFSGAAKAKSMIASVAILLTILEAQLLLSVRHDSQTHDESAHLYAGYSYLKRGDFGINPEHPPLVKLVAALPLLPLGLPDPPPPPIYFRAVSMRGGIQLLYSSDADALLFRARAAATIFTLTLALLVFLAAYEMFGAGAGLIALVLLVFDPNVLANGGLVTTDVGVTCFVFAAVYAFYRYCRKPSVLPLSVCCLATGLALAAKHSAAVLALIFIVLAVAEVARRRAPGDAANELRGRQALRMMGVMATVAVVSATILWAFYGFRYAARPGNAPFIPTTAEYLNSLKDPVEASAIGFMERHRVLPEAYLFGMTDVVMVSQKGRPTFLLGRNYPVGQWFYFPAVFAVKSTIGFMLLLALVFAAKDIWRYKHRREVTFLLIPPFIWLAFAMTSKLNLGIRHILPVIPFLIVLAAAAGWTVARQSRKWAIIVAILLCYHVVSSLHTFPNYLPYSNEAFGGSSNTYKVLADANVGWSGGLKTLANYLNDHHIAHCWFAFDGPNSPAYYHIPCTSLPTAYSVLTGRAQGTIPEQIQGTVFIDSLALAGSDWGPDDLNPYKQFVGMRPAAVLDGEILEFDGSFQVPAISGLSHFAEGNQLMRRKQLDAALLEFKTATQLDPDFIPAHEVLATLYAQKKQTDPALAEYETAMHIYKTVHPEYQAFNKPPANPLAQH